MSVPRRGIVTYKAAQDAFAALEQRISEESDAANLLDLIIHINILIELLDDQIGKIQKRFIQ